MPDGQLGLIAPVTVEVVNNSSEVCCGDTYERAEIIRNEPELFKAKARNLF